eukprot:511775-Pleurochrysis_carterae.AAC.1
MCSWRQNSSRLKAKREKKGSRRGELRLETIEMLGARAREKAAAMERRRALSQRQHRERGRLNTWAHSNYRIDAPSTRIGAAPHARGIHCGRCKATGARTRSVVTSQKTAAQLRCARGEVERARDLGGADLVAHRFDLRLCGGDVGAKRLVHRLRRRAHALQLRAQVGGLVLRALERAPKLGLAARRLQLACDPACREGERIRERGVHAA